jgi:hypothetical protein
MSAAPTLSGGLRLKNGIARKTQSNSSSASKLATVQKAEIVPYIKLMKDSRTEDEHLGGARGLG